jgi:hypothetical protein
MARRATTYRIDPAVDALLVTLSDVLGRPRNQLVNEAVREFVERRSKEVEADLEATLVRLRAHRARDPDFQGAIQDWVDAEASSEHDPAEGDRTENAPRERKRARALGRRSH